MKPANRLWSRCTSSESRVSLSKVGRALRKVPIFLDSNFSGVTGVTGKRLLGSESSGICGGEYSVG